MKNDIKIVMPPVEIKNADVKIQISQGADENNPCIKGTFSISQGTFDWHDKRITTNRKRFKWEEIVFLLNEVNIPALRKRMRESATKV